MAATADRKNKPVRFITAPARPKRSAPSKQFNLRCSLGWRPLAPTRDQIKRLRAAIREYNDAKGCWHWVTLSSTPAMSGGDCASWSIMVDCDHSMDAFRLGQIAGWLQCHAGLGR